MRKSENAEFSEEECNFDIDEAEECMFNQASVPNKIRSTKMRLISFTLNKFKWVSNKEDREDSTKTSATSWYETLLLELPKDLLT